MADEVGGDAGDDGDDDELNEPSSSKRKREKNKTCKPKAKGTPKKPKAKASPKKKTRASRVKTGEPSESSEVLRKKKLQSRKSSAYHVAKKKAKMEGKTDEEAIAAAKLVSCPVYRTVRFCYRVINSTHISIPRVS